MELDTHGTVEAFSTHKHPSIVNGIGYLRGMKSSLRSETCDKIYSTSETRMAMQDEATSGQRHDRPLVQIAPMLDVTYFEFRQFMRLITKRAQLWSEMMADGSLIYGDKDKVHQLLQFSPNERPIVVQLGGNNIDTLRQAAKIALSYGYDEVNLNAGCPSARVSGKGCFGAALMNEAALVSGIVRQLKDEFPVPVTVKHRLGVDHNDSYEFVRDFVRTVAEGGCTHFIVHARKAWLHGINPRKNRSIPPLDHDRVYRLCKEFPQLNFTLNGGIKSLCEIKDALDKGVYGVMVGRMAYENPCGLVRVDTDIYGEAENPSTCKTRRILLEAYADFIDANSERTESMNVCVLVKPILGTFHGEAGTRLFRQALSDMDAYEKLNFHKGKTKSAQYIHRAIQLMETINPDALDRPLH
ncbi:tRNA-dihydrouridine(20/20a) synthase [Babesia sp. Xinjiang]|uniref:tRNA-dihydrouridine(20/20a) synthase n=1 Tax=Babesia sp. Xinjiang TaxID=462227 RepID=UPI000A2456D7|nr:tRNA-dihydrouridine(20/20a) synthase [Babesia sp. Xinjiang]ORM40509.1 tRNA-dihydrouridine(20/20a) synthase [Babesia sp. Xinjiang]